MFLIPHLNYNLIHFLLNVVFHHCSISAWLALASKTKLDAGFKRSILYLKHLRKFCFLCYLSYCALKTPAKILYAFIHTNVRGWLLYNWSITYCTNYSFCEVPQLDCILCNSVKIWKQMHRSFFINYIRSHNSIFLISLKSSDVGQHGTLVISTSASHEIGFGFQI